MRSISIVMLLCCMLWGVFPFSQVAIVNAQNSTTDVENHCLNKMEMELYNLLMKYRKQKGLSKIPLSKSLSYVARTHCTDLNENKPDKPNRCNMHSWSDAGDWSECCYTNDHKKSSCMWDKPKELTSYEGQGYEIAYFSTDLSPSGALNGWKRSNGHNIVIVNKQIWKGVDWNAIGIGIEKNYAVVWFGEESDPAGSIDSCQ